MSGGAELLTLRLPSDPASVRQARRAVAEAVAETAGSGVPYELELVVSELVSNAIEHGSDSGDSVELELTRRGDAVRVLVRDPARHRSQVPMALTPSEERVRGRGLHVIDRLAAAWGERIADGCREVWAELRLEPPPATR